MFYDKHTTAREMTELQRKCTPSSLLPIPQPVRYEAPQPNPPNGLYTTAYEIRHHVNFYHYPWHTTAYDTRA